MPAVRPRNAAATRRDLLTATRELLTRHGVKGTTIRDVAGAVGVNAALVYRYFGSKEKLIAEAVYGDERRSNPLDQDLPADELPGALLDLVLDASARQAEGGSLSALVAASGDDSMRGIIRHRIESEFAGRLADRLTGPQAELRAELMVALLIGVAVLRDSIGTREITRAERSDLAEHIATMTLPILR